MRYELGSLFHLFWRLLLFYFIFGKSAGAQTNWQKITDIPGKAVYALTGSADRLYAATADRIYRSTDAGATWTPGGIIHENDDEVIDVLWADGVLYAAMVVNGCYVSTDDGLNWQAHNTGLQGLGALNLSMLARRGDSLFVATNGSGIFVKPCTPWWAPWQPFNQNQGWGNVGSIVAGDGTLLAGAGASAKVSRCGPESPQWTEYAFDQFNGVINGFLGGIRQGDIWLGAGMQGLYRSADDGRSWEKFDPNVGLLNIASFAPWQGATVVVLTKAGGQSYWRNTLDAGENWSDFSPTPPGNFSVYDLRETQGLLWSARADGLWRLAAPQVDTETPAAPEVSLAPVYPNPNYDGKVMLPLTLSKPAVVRYELIDLQGHVRQSGFLGRLEAGRYDQVVDVQMIESGSLLCAVYVDGRVFTQVVQIFR